MESVESNETVLLYHGRELEVSLALSPQELDKMKESGTEKTDRRNLFLAKEGSESRFICVFVTNYLIFRRPVWIRSS